MGGEEGGPCHGVSGSSLRISRVLLEGLKVCLQVVVTG